MTAVATWVASLKGWRRALFAVGLGALSLIAFAPLHLWPVLFLTFGPLIWLLDGCHRDHNESLTSFMSFLFHMVKNSYVEKKRDTS